MKHWRYIIIYSAICAVTVLLCSGCAGAQSAHNNDSPTASANPTQTPLMGTPAPTILYQSSLKAPLDGWPATQNVFASSDGYHIVGGYLAFAPLSDQTSVAISVDVMQIQGSTQADYGIAFRRTPNNRYEFDIDSSGDWYVLKDVDTNHTNLVELTPNSAIHTGLNVTNHLKVEANGSHFKFYVNGALVGQVDDSTHPSGEVGIDGDNNAELVYTNFVVSALT